MKHIITEGDAYYGNGEASCFTCWHAGKILRQEGGGHFENDALTQAQVSLLLEAAREHERKNPSHVVRVYEFKRGEGESHQTGW